MMFFTGKNDHFGLGCPGCQWLGRRVHTLSFFVMLLCLSTFLGGVATINVTVAAAATGSATVTTLAGSGVAGFTDGTGATAQFSNPRGVVVDSNDNF